MNCKHTLTLTLALLVAGCATTKAPAPALPDLSQVERAAIPKGITPECYPDAVVFEYTQDKKHPRVSEHRKNGTIAISAGSTAKTIGPRVSISDKVLKSCIPETSFCDVFLRRKVIVLRKRPIKMGGVFSGIRSVKMEDGREVWMLDATWEVLQGNIIHALNIAYTPVTEAGRCNDIGVESTVVSPGDNRVRLHNKKEVEITGLRRKLVAAFADGDYLNIHAMRRVSRMFFTLRRAMNGCFDSQEERKALHKGEAFMAKLLGL